MQTSDFGHVREPGPGDGRAPPGQTRPDNLAPLCRRHHRRKTTGGWTYQRQPEGTYHWTDPHGHTYTVNQHGTRNLA